MDAAFSVRAAALEDIAIIMEIERGEGFEHLVAQSDESVHRARLARADVRHWLLEDARGVRAFAIVDGIDDPHGGFYLRRIAARERGAGDGARLLDWVLHWAFDEAGAPRFWLDVLAHNTGARRAYARAGFVEEGVMRSAYRLPDGARTDRVILSILPDEWRALQRGRDGSR